MLSKTVVQMSHRIFGDFLWVLIVFKPKNTWVGFFYVNPESDKLQLL